MSKDVLGTFSATSRASLSLIQSKFLHRPLVPRFIKFLVKALPGDDVRFTESDLGTTIGNFSIVLHFVGSFHYLWTSWLIGIFFGSAKAEIPKWKFSTMRCTNHIGVMKQISVIT